MANSRSRYGITDNTNTYLNALDGNMKASCSSAILNVSNAAFNMQTKMDDLLKMLFNMQRFNITRTEIGTIHSKSKGILELTLTALRKAEEATEKCTINNIEQVKNAVKITELTYDHMNELSIYIDTLYKDIKNSKIKPNITAIGNIYNVLLQIWQNYAVVAYKRWYNLTPAGRKQPMPAAGGRRKRTHRKRKHRKHKQRTHRR
jgi:hypothetical protein